MTRPQNVGIKAIEVYLPSQYLEQSELEEATGVAAGKLTIGLGQTKMAFVNDREDIYSMSLTVLSRLLAKHNIDTANIGRLEVGTETLLDKSKSVKTVLMQLMGDNHDIEGVDTVNACYGGTNAVFNAMNWVESSNWDGRDAIVVCGDIAIYGKGAARPTGGAGTVAMLIGPDAPLVLDPTHGIYMENAYDFFKPDFTSEYPVVDGHYSLTCYTKALDHAYSSYNKKAKNTEGLDRFDYSVFHVPTCKLVQKSYARLLYNDFRANPEKFAEAAIPEEIKGLDYDKSLVDKQVEKTFVGLVKERSAKHMAPSLTAATNVGNIYTGSVYLSLASLLTFVATSELANKRVSLFSYGSGLAAAFYSLKVQGDISTIVEKLALKESLDERVRSSFADYEAAIALREKAHLQKSFKPAGSIDHLRKGTYYLVEIDDMFRRSYAIKE